MTAIEDPRDDERREGDDDRFVPSPRQLVAMAVALMFLAGSVGFALGARTGGDRPGADSVDVGFLEDMVTHHQQAIRLSNLELINGSDPGVEVFAREIIFQQSYEIGGMESQLVEWRRWRPDRPATAMAWMGGAPVPEAKMPGMASAAELELLETRTGRDADALFIALMQDHHRGGVHMAEVAARLASSDFVRELAARMARTQKLEIAEMTLARNRSGLSASPPGYAPDPIPASVGLEHTEHGDS